LIVRAAVGGGLLFGLAYGGAGLVGLLETPYMPGSRLGNGLFLLFCGAWLGIVVGLIVGCAGAAIQWLIGQWKRNAPRSDWPE
jgi:hypothetical protein